MPISSGVQKIKERLSIEEVVSSYIKLEKAGNSLKAKCPFHNEKTPSFFVSADRGTYYCFGCGASGDIFTFVEEFEGLDFKGSLKLLADRAGVQLESFSKENKESASEKERLYAVMKEAGEYFVGNLNEEVLGYLKGRGLNEKSLSDFRVGYALPEWRALYFHLKSKNFTDGEMEKAGLIKKSEKDSGGNNFYDRFRGRIIFPISDSSGRIIAFSGRLFKEDSISGKESAKYLNSPETPIFSKNAVLYGIDKAKDSIRKNNFSILVEGQMDLILSHQSGYRNTIATSGTALSDSTVSKENVVSNLGLVRRLSSNIVLSFDADKAGANATIRAGKIALSLGMDVKVTEMPEGVDPADMISKMGLSSWKETIKNSKHIIEFLSNKIIKNSKGDTRKAGREIREKVLPFVGALQSSIEKSFFLKKISDMTGIQEGALLDDLKKIEKETELAGTNGEERKTKGVFDRKDYIERKLLGIFLWQRGLPADSPKKIDFENIPKELAQILKIRIDDVYKRAEGNTEDLIFEAEVFYGEEVNLEGDIREMVSNLKEEYLREELNKKMIDLHIAEEKKDTILSSQILKECQDLSNKIQDIKNNRLNKK